MRRWFGGVVRYPISRLHYADERAGSDDELLIRTDAGRVARRRRGCGGGSGKVARSARQPPLIVVIDSDGGGSDVLGALRVFWGNLASLFVPRLGAEIDSRVE